MEITPQALCCAGQLLTQLRKLIKEAGALSEEAATLIHDIRQLLRKGKNEANRLAGQRDDAVDERNGIDLGKDRSNSLRRHCPDQV